MARLVGASLLLLTVAGCRTTGSGDTDSLVNAWRQGGAQEADGRAYPVRQRENFKFESGFNAEPTFRGRNTGNGAANRNGSAWYDALFSWWPFHSDPQRLDHRMHALELRVSNMNQKLERRPEGDTQTYTLEGSKAGNPFDQ